jgi:EmrB/QacA subfamily drug resistance transporter
MEQPILVVMPVAPSCGRTRQRSVLACSLPGCADTPCPRKDPKVPHAPDSAAPASPRSPTSDVRPGRVLAVLCGGSAFVFAAVSMVNVGLPDLARDIGATQNEALWVVNLYSLVFAALLLPASALGDIIGRRRTFVVGLGLFAAFSAVSALVRDPALLIATRGAAGLGAAMVMPTSLTIITATFPVEEKGKAIGIWAGVSGASGTLGLVLSGAMLEVFDWTSIFWVCAGASALGVVATLALVPESRDEQASRFDVGGALLSALGLGGVVYTIIEQPVKGWDASVLGALAVGVVGLVGFVVYELRREQPMLDPRLFAGRAFGTGSLSLVLGFGAALGLFVIIFQYLQYTLGYSTLEAGLAVTVQGVGIVGAASASDALARRIGLGITGGIGLGLLAAGFALLAVMSDADSSYWALLPGLIVAGVGLGLSSAPATTSILSGAPAHAQGSASGVNNAAREVGGALGIAVMGSALNSTYADRVDVTGLSQTAAGAAQESLPAALQVAQGLGDRGARLAADAQSAFVDGFHASIWVGTAALVVSALVLLAVGPRRGQVRLDLGDGFADADAARPDPTARLGAAA